MFFWQFLFISNYSKKPKDGLLFFREDPESISPDGLPHISETPNLAIIRIEALRGMNSPVLKPCNRSLCFNYRFLAVGTPQKGLSQKAVHCTDDAAGTFQKLKSMFNCPFHYGYDEFARNILTDLDSYICLQSWEEGSAVPAHMDEGGPVVLLKISGEAFCLAAVMTDARPVEGPAANRHSTNTLAAVMLKHEILMHQVINRTSPISARKMTFSH